jgi:hypothetical protein
MKTLAMIASHRNYETASDDHFWRPSTSDFSEIIKIESRWIIFSL